MLLALTGGIATGKSTFYRMLAERHPFTLFDADAYVHKLLDTDKKLISAIEATFGSGVIDKDGRVNRPVLRGIVFSNPAARKELESLVHPKVRKEWQTLRSSCLKKQTDLLADIPLLFETHAEEYFDATIVTSCSPSIQMNRLHSRGLESDEIETILARQLPLTEKASRATSVVWNDGCLDVLRRQADLVISRFFSANNKP